MTMQIIVQELRRLIQEYTRKISAISDADFSAKPNPKKWSKVEVLGHLIDSAQNNHRRFVCGQYEAAPPRILYDQDFWVQANNYKSGKKENVIQLWRLLNERICDVLETMPQANYAKECNTGRDAVQLHSLETTQPGMACRRLCKTYETPS
jgi:hypothetical protein